MLINDKLVAFAKHWRFSLRACAPYQARTKGKTESGVGYLKKNAIAGHSFESWEAFEAHLAKWEREVANVRVHGTIVDVLGYLPLEPDAAHLFIRLVCRRHEAGAMLITSNRSVADWSTLFDDPVVAAAILDRLLHHSHVPTVRGDSYRLRAMRKSGLIKPPAGDGAEGGGADRRPVTGGTNQQPRSST